jgi:hypothetical protein
MRSLFTYAAVLYTAAVNAAPFQGHSASGTLPSIILQLSLTSHSFRISVSRIHNVFSVCRSSLLVSLFPTNLRVPSTVYPHRKSPSVLPRKRCRYFRPSDILAMILSTRQFRKAQASHELELLSSLAAGSTLYFFF